VNDMLKGGSDFKKQAQNLNEAPNKEAPSNGKLLFVKYSALGDIALATAAASCIKAHFPSLSLFWLAAKPYDELLSGQPFVDEVLPWDRSRDPRAFFGLLRRVRGLCFDWLVDMQWVQRSALLSALSGAKRRLGFFKGHRFPYYDWTPENWRYEDPILERQSAMLEGLGISDGLSYSPRLCVSGEESRAAEPALNVPEPRCAALIGASKPVKRWPAQNWVSFLRMMISRGWSALLVGHGREEEGLARKIALQLPESRTANLVGALDLKEMAALFSRVQLAVGGDTGPLYLAIAAGVPSVGLFGPTNPKTHFPDLTFTASLSAPCPRSGCNDWNCPNADCLSAILPHEVFEAVQKLGL